MKIAFWSNVHQKGCVTTNMACVAAVMAMVGMGRSILLENHYSMNSLGNLMLPQDVRGKFREHGQYYDKYGIEYMMKRLYAGTDGHTLLRQTQLPLLFNQLYYLPQSYVVNRDVFDYEFGQVYRELFECLESSVDYVFIDTERNQNLSSGTILSEADLVVVNLCQEPEVLDEFFGEYQSLREKAVYLIGAYQRELPWNYQRIVYEYHISSKKIGVIPYNLELKDAVARGRVLQYLSQNMHNIRVDDNGFFMRQCKKSACMIRSHLLQAKREKKATAI